MMTEGDIEERHFVWHIPYACRGSRCTRRSFWCALPFPLSPFFHCHQSVQESGVLTNGYMAGFFTYISGTQEQDIEFLSSDVDYYQRVGYTNQPGSVGGVVDTDAHKVCNGVVYMLPS